MGTLLTFQPLPHASRSPEPGAEMGKLLLFTGIRYERMDAAERPQPKQGRRARSRRPT